MRFSITDHCKLRYYQRINNLERMQLVPVILKELVAAKDITDKIYNEVPRFIIFLYEKYKSASQRVLKYDDRLYIIRKRKGALNLWDVLTVYKDTEQIEQFKNTSMSRQDIFIKISFLKKQYKNA